MGKSYYSTVFDAPAARVWAIVRDFNGLATWFAGSVSVSDIEGGKSGEAVSGVRNFLFGDTRIREQLVALSDVDCSYTYVFCDPAPFPVLNYLATLRLAFSLYNLQRYAESATFYKKLVDLHPADVEVRAGLGWALLKMGKYKEAAAEFHFVLDIAPRNELAKEGLKALGG